MAAVDEPHKSHEATANAELASEGVTVVIAVYNESDHIESVVSQVVDTCNRLDRPYRICILDDASTDWNQPLEESLQAHSCITVEHMCANRGKGAVLNDAFPDITTPWTLVIDGDNEYAATDIPMVLEPLFNDRADWVMGSRYGFGRKRPKQYLLTYLVNRAFSALFSLLSGRRFNDVLTGLYAFRTATMKGVQLQEERFAYTPELLWKVHRIHHPRWMDVPISYHFRTYQEGKKIRWWEVFTVTKAMIKYRFFNLK